MQESLFRQARALLAKSTPYPSYEKFWTSLTASQQQAYQLLKTPPSYTQCVGWGKEFSRLVPLAACYKQYNNHHYSNLPLVEHLFWPVYTHIKQARQDPIYTHLGQLNLIELRTKHCSNPQTQHRLVKLPPYLKSVPQTYWIWLCQIWVCHPQNRHQLTICDPHYLDKHPQPLIEPLFK